MRHVTSHDGLPNPWRTPHGAHTRGAPIRIGPTNAFVHLPVQSAPTHPIRIEFVSPTRWVTPTGLFKRLRLLPYGGHKKSGLSSWPQYPKYIGTYLATRPVPQLLVVFRSLCHLPFHHKTIASTFYLTMYFLTTSRTLTRAPLSMLYDGTTWPFANLASLLTVSPKLRHLSYTSSRSIHYTKLENNYLIWLWMWHHTL